MIENSLLLELPVPVFVVNGEYCIEWQAWNGLHRWLDNFSEITLCAMLNEDVPRDVSFASLEPLLSTGRLRLECLPYRCWSLFAHYRVLLDVKRRFNRLIKIHQYLCFATLGWLGCWGNVAAEEAHRLKRPYAVWCDAVSHEMFLSSSNNFFRNCIRKFKISILKKKSLSAIIHSGLGLFHGMNVYEGYRNYCINPHVVHDIHFVNYKYDTIEDLENELSLNVDVVRVGYVGRVLEIKGPREWVQTLLEVSRLVEKKIRFECYWLGGGEMLEEMKSEAIKLQDEVQIVFLGNESDPLKVVEFYNSLHLFVFCHLTPESPRNLIEALLSGVPLVGFDSPYARDLLSTHGGGVLVPFKDTSSLAGVLRDLLTDHDTRVSLARDAWLAGQQFDADTVFRHRSDLIKKYL